MKVCVAKKNSCNHRSRTLQCQRIFQVSAPVNCVCLHPNQSELVVGDQSGVIHLWDLKTDHNEQLVRTGQLID